MNVQGIQSQEATTATSTATTGTQNTTDFSSYLGENTSLDEIFSQASAAYNVPKDLLMAIGFTESTFNPKATSKSGAQGVMQLMPSTSRYLGVSDPYDPYQNIMGGAKLMRELLDEFDGDVTLALASYNAGSNNVKKYGGIPPFEQTQKYVVKVTSHLQAGISAPTTPISVASHTAPAPVAPAPTQTAQVQTASASITSNIPEIKEEPVQDSLLQEIFSYDDYLRFIELYTKIQNAENEKREEEEKEKKEQSNSHFSYQGIHYTPAVLNLLSGN